MAEQTDGGTLREAVRSHRAEILHAHLRWPDLGLGEGPQIVSADRALWTAAGVEEDHPYEDEPVTRLHGLVDRFRTALEEIAKCDCHAAETALKALGF